MHSDTQPVLRIFSYLPNPRVWKTLIAARLCDVTVDVRGAPPPELGTWLWDFDARQLAESERSPASPHAQQGRRGFSGTLYKTEEFLRAHPFATVPAGFSPDGSTGVFESNSILRAVARQGARLGNGTRLYGRDDWEASRIDSFLDANLVFAREAQVWLLALGGRTFTEEQHARMAAAYAFWLDGLEAALAHGNGFLVGEQLSIADISFVCDFAQFLREQHYARRLAEISLLPVSAGGAQQHPAVYGRLDELSAAAPFAEWLQPYLAWRNSA